ncbi:hypothetical protein GcC1_216033 [Golovinomyces cichoracearum]|uniref:Uncharacterized protein n=1 Tax=Golovinomyces cichoracearum TaxID=62708 RepID=A0A420H971_9PEZI|nr:hypothetical protein GcC1_216033 [Golovinomyces cichoracearum]
MSYILKAESQIWAELGKKWPEKLKKCIVPFPWFEKIRELYGDGCCQANIAFWDDIDKNTVEDDPFIWVSPSYAGGSGSGGSYSSGLNLMEKIGDGMIAIAKSLAVPTAIDISAQSEGTLQGQAQKLIHPGVKVSHTRKILDYARITSKS